MASEMIFLWMDQSFHQNMLVQKSLVFDWDMIGMDAFHHE